MNPRSVAIQGGLAALALLLAYVTWQRQPELTSGEVFVLEITKNDLEKVRFEDAEGKSWSELTKAKDADGVFVEVKLSGYDNTAVALPSGHPGIALKMPERLVRGNETALRLFERFTPFRASRALGALDAVKVKELGLDTTKKTLEITARGLKHRFAIVPAPPGGSDPYVQNLEDKKVYIVPRQILSDMQSATTNLVERRLHSFRVEDADRLVITAGSTRREFVASRNDEYPGIRLAPVEAADKPDETLKNWHDRIFGLFPAEVMGKGEVPSTGAPALAIKIEYTSRGRSLGFVELGRNPPSQESSAGTPPPSLAYARSEFTSGWMKLSGDALGLIDEGEKLLAKK